MGEFWVNFLANILADAILSVVVYWAVTQPREKKSKQTNMQKALGLLMAEIKVNRVRATRYVRALGTSAIEEEVRRLFPLRLTRGAWNALKESNLLPQLNDAQLVYYLLRMNEAALVANRNLRKLQLACLGDTEADMSQLAETAKRNCEHFLIVSSRVVDILGRMALPSFEIEELEEKIGLEEPLGKDRQRRHA